MWHVRPGMWVAAITSRRGVSAGRGTGEHGLARATGDRERSMSRVTVNCEARRDYEYSSWHLRSKPLAARPRRPAYAYDGPRWGAQRRSCSGRRGGARASLPVGACVWTLGRSDALALFRVSTLRERRADEVVVVVGPHTTYVPSRYTRVAHRSRAASTQTYIRYGVPTHARCCRGDPDCWAGEASRSRSRRGGKGPSESFTYVG
ncbi:hypothetical protein C8Q80DRAFT_14759 [Daedaleopsis nitida]|nr:hypothetical protein C8Q80DRAFT_14759 [Daedaleopsis nitida]